MRKRAFAFVAVALAVLLLLSAAWGIGSPPAAAAHDVVFPSAAVTDSAIQASVITDPAITSQGARSALAQAAGAANAGFAAPTDQAQWTPYADTNFGFTIEMPAGWSATPGDGSSGSVTHFAAPSGSPAVNVGILSYDRPVGTALRDWVQLPADLGQQVQINSDRPTLYSDQTVIESYLTGEGSVRRAYVARGSKVYFVDLIPDDPAYDATFSYMLLSLTFTDQVVRPQATAGELYTAYSNLYLPMLQGGAQNSAASATASAAASAAVRPATDGEPRFRLPFTGEFPIVQGPGCGPTHQGPDMEAIDFGLPSSTALVADRLGLLKRYPDLVGYGNTVKIIHADGQVSWYSHLRQFERPDGLVFPGQLIGESGGGPDDPGRGDATVAHLHFMVLGAETRAAVSIRTWPGITWYSGDPANPCNDGSYGHPKPDGGFYDGVAKGPALGDGQQPSCTAPELQTPADGEIFSTAVITLTWKPGSCTGAGYLLRIRNAPDGQEGGAIVLELSRNVQQWVGVVPPRWQNQDLYWSVKTSGERNVGWAPTRRFRVQPPVPPVACAAPELQSPADGAEFAGGTVTFAWSDVACTHAGFLLRIRTGAQIDGAGDTVINLPSGTTQRTYTVASKWYNRDLYWSVRALADGAVWAPMRVFRINAATALDKPVLVSPEQNAQLYDNQDVTFTWNAVTGASYYRVALKSGDGEPLIVCDWEEATTCRVGRLWPGPKAWSVKARGPGGLESEWAEAWPFTVLATSPSPLPTPEPPPSGDVGRPTPTEPQRGRVLPHDTDITLRWQAATNAAQYKVEIRQGLSQPTIACDWQADLSCHLGVLTPGIRAWHVKARDAQGHEGAWSELWGFMIQP